MPVFEFDRYVNGQLMAEGVTISRQPDLPSAAREAARRAARGPKGECPVLVLRTAMIYPKLKDIKPGDLLKADGGFTCLAEGQLCEVRQDEAGLYVHCSGADDAPDPDRRQHHYLDGQENEAGECVGFARVEPAR